MDIFRIALSFLIAFVLAMGGCYSAGEDPFTDKELAQFDFKIEVELVSLAGEPQLKIKESFIMPRSEIMFKLPSIFLRTDRLYDRMSNVKVSGSAVLSYHRRDPSIILIEQEPGKRVELSYYYSPYDERNYPGKQESFSAPIIRYDYVQFVGLMALAYPLPLMESKSFSLDFQWKMPSGFQMFNSFGATSQQKIITDFDKLRDSLFVAGSKMRSYELQVLGRPVYVSIESNFLRINDESFIEVIKKLLVTQRKTWQDDDFPYFFINILSNQQPCSGNIKFAGTAHTNSFRAFFPSDCPFLPEMKQLISHELTHMWIGKKIKVGKERGHIDGKWFTEGWTDYFGRLLAYNAQVLTETEYFDSLNRQLEKYSVSSAKYKPLYELVDTMYKREYSSRDLEDVPYQQGEIMAINLNQIIKKSSNFRYSLKDVVRKMLKEAKLAGGVKNFSPSEIAQIVDEYDQGASNTFNAEYSKIEEGQNLYPLNLDDCQILQKRSSRFPNSSGKEQVISYARARGSCERWLN